MSANHHKGNIEALGLELSEEEIDEIDNAAPFDVGFPLNFLFEFAGGKYNVKSDASDIGLIKSAGHLDTVKNPSVSALSYSRVSDDS